MKTFDFVTDMAVESANMDGIKKYCTSNALSYGIEQHTLKITTSEASKSIGKPCGVYVTYDCQSSIHSDKRAQLSLIRYISSTLQNLIGIVKKSAPVLVVGLGNKNITADSLGEKSADKIEVTRLIQTSYRVQSVCAFDTGVLGTTGIQSAEIVKGISDRIKPCAVVAVDALATSVVSRVGKSFQISTAGITPGSGVGQDKERIDKSVIGVPVISLGVPLMLSMRTALYNFVKNYSQSINQSVDEFGLRTQLSDSNLLNLVVAPKEIDYLVEKCAYIISSAVNAAFE